MRIVRHSILALLVATLAPGLPVVADHVTATIRISGVVRPDQPLARLDPLSPWLLAQVGAPVARINPGALENVPIDSLQSWLIDAQIGDVQRWRGATFDGPLDLDDPRLVGWLSMSWSTDVHPLPGSSASIHVATVRLEAGGDAWVGSLTGTGDPATGSFWIAGSLDGTGASVGDTLIVDIRSVGLGSEWHVEGLAVTGDLPPSEPVVG